MKHGDRFIDDNGFEHTFSSQEAFDYTKAMTEKYGRFNPQSEFSMFNTVQYLLDGQEQVGAIMWATQATKEQVAQYIIRPLSPNRKPDIVSSGNIIGLATQEQTTAMHRILDDINTTHILIPTSTVGCYYRDRSGEPWTTFQAINHTETCSQCGASIGSGYQRGMLGEEQYFCGEHIHIEQEQK